MRISKNPSNIREKCIKEIGEIALVQVEVGDEEGVMKSIDTLMSLSTQSNQRPNSTDVTRRVKREDRPHSRVATPFDRAVRKEK